MSTTFVKNTTILYVDDDSDDLQLLEEAFLAVDPTYKMLQASNGAEGLEKLHDLALTGDLPCIIVLDINMPKMCGKEAFQRIRANPALSGIPIVIFSTSNNPKDKAFFEAPNVAYMTKPINYAYLTEVAKQLILFCKNNSHS